MNNSTDLNQFPIAEKGDASFISDVFSATAQDLENLRLTFPFYDQIMSAFQDGNAKVELKKRFMLKMVDEVWVRIVEDTLPSLDVIIRKPGVLLQEIEEVLPVEQTRKVTGRSVQHLSQHTDLIDEIRADGTIVPSKILNVFQDDTMLTYENKFINTLLTRLYGFVEMRYQNASECGEDEKNTTLNFDQEFLRGEQKTKIHLSIEVSEPPHENEVVKNYIYSSDLWKRVEKLHKVVSDYMGSSFVQSMGRAYVRPPIMRTNKLLKNVDFRQCLALWEFLEAYENTGYETLIQENLENVSEDCIRDFCNSIAAQYVIFQKHIENEFVDSATLDSREIDQVLHPQIKQELDPFNERDYDLRDLVPDKKPEGSITETGFEDDIEQAILIALAADDLFMAEEEDHEEEAVLNLEEDEIAFRYRYSYLARVIRAQNPTQDFLTAVKNELLAYKNVKSRISWNYDSFNVGRKKIARLNVKGKTLYLYLPLDVSNLDSKYHAIDVSDLKRMQELPCLLKIRSDRAVKYAKELIAMVMEANGIVRLETPTFVDYHRPFATNEEMAAWNPPLVQIVAGGEFGAPSPDLESTEENNSAAEQDVSIGNSTGIEYRYRYSFLARLILAQNPTQDFYSEVKNELLSYQKVKARIAWKAESFHAGRLKCARVNVKGKTLYLYLPLNPADFEGSKYHTLNVAKDGEECDFPLLLKIRSERAVKYAKELIALAMQQQEIARLENPEICDYHLPYETADEMAARDSTLVKLVTGNDSAAEDAKDETVAAWAPENAQLQEENTQNDADSVDAQTSGFFISRYRYSFLARLILAQNPTQDFYSELKNELLSYKKVKARTSWKAESFNAGRLKCARLNIKGKTLYLYLPLNPADYEGSKYHTVNVTKDGEDCDLPMLLKVRSERALKYAKELIALAMQQLNLIRLENIEVCDYHLPYETADEMAARNPALVKIVDAKLPANGNLSLQLADEPKEMDVSSIASPAEDDVAYRYRYSFLARYIQAEDPVQPNYCELKNLLLSYQKVKSKISWGYEAYRLGKQPIAKMKVKGKTIILLLALDPNLADPKYKVKDLTYAHGVLQILQTQIKVRSSRTLKYAKELIALMMSTLDTPLGELQNVDYRMPYQTTEELLALPSPLVKIGVPTAGAATNEISDETDEADDEEN